MEHVVDGAIVAVYPVREFGRVLDEDLGEQFGRRERWWGIEREMLERGCCLHTACRASPRARIDLFEVDGLVRSRTTSSRVLRQRFLARRRTPSDEWTMRLIASSANVEWESASL